LLHTNLDKNVRKDFAVLHVHIKRAVVYSSVSRSCAEGHIDCTYVEDRSKRLCSPGTLVLTYRTFRHFSQNCGRRLL